MNKLIACQLHDTIEVVCLYRYRVKLTLKDGSVVEGVAKDIELDSEKREFLLLTQPDSHVELVNLARMDVLTANAVFSEVEF
jgi:Rho-binding antiterminator